MNDDEREEVVARFMASIRNLSADEQFEAIQNLISAAIKQSSDETIIEIRQEILDQFPDHIPIVASVLDILDGQLALRRIAGKSYWR